MNKLSCSVTNCVSNKQGGCCRPAIQVEGAAANCSKETMCGSYQPKGGADNACCRNTVNDKVAIGCSASVCQYNKEQKCTSDSVCISCNCGCGDLTECQTFKL